MYANTALIELWYACVCESIPRSWNGYNNLYIVCINIAERWINGCQAFMAEKALWIQLFVWLTL